VWKLARTPRWIGFLVFALAVAAGFAALGQWQLSRAVASGTVVVRPTETVVPLESVAEPQEPVTSKAAQQLVSVSGTFVPNTGSVLVNRLNGGESGYWVMAEFQTDAGPSAAVALGWAADKSAATSVAAVLPTGEVELTARLLSSEDPSLDDFESGERQTASVAALVNEWPVAPESVYSGYLVDRSAPAGLTVIDAPKPTPDSSLNLLNVFYAIEWVVFAGLAIFMWYRLLKDAYEREIEEAEDAAREREAAQAKVN
jgi:cytochrome oxidase assembly protein ShyY1